MGDWSDYFEDYPEENPGNYDKSGRFDPTRCSQGNPEACPRRSTEVLLAKAMATQPVTKVDTGNSQHQHPQEPRKLGTVAQAVGLKEKDTVRTNYVFVDYENVQVASLALLKAEHFKVYIFLGANNTKLPVSLFLSMQELGQRVELVTLEASGKNALDFHIAYYLGTLAAIDPKAFFHIISKDSGFDPLIHHLRTKNIYSARSASIADMPCLQPPAISHAAQPPPAISHAAQPPPLEIQSKNRAVSTSHAALVDKAIALVINGKATKPTTRKTLFSTLHSKLGKGLPPQSIEDVLLALVKKGHVKVNDKKVSYAIHA
jgi:hypothetical protein